MKKLTKNTPSRKRTGIKVLAVIILLAVIGGFVLYTNNQRTELAREQHEQRLDAEDKQRFETVRASVETLHGRLQAAAEPGVEWRMAVGCGQGSTKFQEAKKVCGIGSNMDITITSDTEAVRLIEKYNTLFQGSPDLFTFEREYKTKPSDFPAGLQDGLDGAVYKERD